jgi:hypothetical protein
MVKDGLDDMRRNAKLLAHAGRKATAEIVQHHGFIGSAPASCRAVAMRVEGALGDGEPPDAKHEAAVEAPVDRPQQLQCRL